VLSRRAWPTSVAFSPPFAAFYTPRDGAHGSERAALRTRDHPNQEEEPMIELYGMGSPNVVKIYIALEELNLPYTVHPVDVFSGKQFDPAFLKLNPMAKVPVITDSEGPGGKPITLFESGAILLYLAEKAGRLLPKDAAAKYEAIEWMMVQMTTLGPMFGQHVHFVRFAPKGNDYSQSRYTTQVHRVLEVIDHRLAEKPWLGGADYGIADIATYPWARNIPVLLGAAAAEKYKNVMKWVGVISERPAVKKAIAAVDDVREKTTQFDKAQAKDLDRLFGRGQHAAA
jgi:GSH-dependent disulfide-bond oxidoreductase